MLKILFFRESFQVRQIIKKNIYLGGNHLALDIFLARCQSAAYWKIINNNASKVINLITLPRRSAELPVSAKNTSK